MLNKIDNPVIVARCQSVGKEGKCKLIRNYHLCHKTHSITSVIVTVMFISQKLKVSFSIYIRFFLSDAFIQAESGSSNSRFAASIGLSTLTATLTVLDLLDALRYLFRYNNSSIQRLNVLAFISKIQNQIPSR